jgi:hypothetical protein
MTSSKNFALSPAGTDLGLGDQVKQQLEDSEDERKKKLMQQAKQSSATGPATMQLFGTPGAGNGQGY